MYETELGARVIEIRNAVLLLRTMKEHIVRIHRSGILRHIEESGKVFQNF